jgi:hypothetical protein
VDESKQQSQNVFWTGTLIFGRPPSGSGNHKDVINAGERNGHRNKEFDQIGP